MTATPAQWVEALSIALILCGSPAVPFFLLVDADPADFDPRPAVRRLLVTDAGARLLVEIVRARYTIAALAVPNGATR